jgi:hypothetical protein
MLINVKPSPGYQAILTEYVYIIIYIYSFPVLKLSKVACESEIPTGQTAYTVTLPPSLAHVAGMSIAGGYRLAHLDARSVAQ